jgi:hypothetical protein
LLQKRLKLTLSIILRLHKALQCQLRTYRDNIKGAESTHPVLREKPVVIALMFSKDDWRSLSGNLSFSADHVIYDALPDPQGRSNLRDGQMSKMPWDSFLTESSLVSDEPHATEYRPALGRLGSQEAQRRSYFFS